MSQDWEQIRAAYPELVGPLKFLYELPSRYLQLKVEFGTGKTHVTFSAYPRYGRKKLHIYNVCPYENPVVYFHPNTFGALFGADGPDWFSRRLNEAFGSDIRVGKKGYYHIINLADIDKRRDEMSSLLHDVVDRLSQH